MRTYRLLFFALIFLQISCNSQQQKINGVSFVASSRRISTVDVAPVVNVNSNYVALMPFGFLANKNASNVRFNSNRQWFGETKPGLIQYAKAFQQKDISIMVKPQLWIARGGYTGFIEMQTEEEWKQLESSYSNFIITYAKAAEEIQAKLFCIGTELEKFIIKRPLFFKKLIKEIRKVYSGKLTYAANWDEFKRVPFWQMLDFIGIDAYFPLSEKESVSVEDFQKGWQVHKSEIKKVQQQFKKPVLFTEFGYRSVNFTAKEPWVFHKVEGNVNLQNQANGLEAIYNEFWKEDWFAGGFVWKWFVNHNNVGGKSDNRFTPQNKPAEKVLAKLYSKNKE
jgi:hypothetical protein